MPSPLRLAFLGCGFITRVHSRNLRRFKTQIVCGYASRDKAKADSVCGEYRGTGAYSDYADAINDPAVDAVVVAVPPKFHLNLTLQALSAGKHVLVEKPAYPTTADYHVVREARDKARRVVLVGENDHYKPLAVTLRKLLADGAIGEMVFGHFSSVVKRLKEADDWRNDESMAGGDAFFEEGIHWLHLAASLGPKITTITGFRPAASREGPDTRVKSMMVSFAYDNGAVMLVRGEGLPRIVFPGFRDIRGYQAMYRDFRESILSGRQPEMSLERAMDDQRLMDEIYASLPQPS